MGCQLNQTNYCRPFRDVGTIELLLTSFQMRMHTDEDDQQNPIASFHHMI